MAFSVGRRRGGLWEDTNDVMKYIKKQDFNVSGSTEREFEIQISNYLKAHEDDLNGSVISQYSHDHNVASAKFFGKKHRPDMSIDEDGTAIELKYINTSLDGVRNAIGQAYIYRKAYKFVILIFVISRQFKEVYEDEFDDHKQRADLKNIFYTLSENNIFTIVKPNFKPKDGYGHTIMYFPED